MSLSGMSGISDYEKNDISDKRYVIALLRTQVYDKCCYYSLKCYWESVWYGYLSPVSLSVIKLLN